MKPSQAWIDKWTEKLCDSINSEIDAEILGLPSTEKESFLTDLEVETIRLNEEVRKSSENN